MFYETCKNLSCRLTDAADGICNNRDGASHKKLFIDFILNTIDKNGTQ